jgi:hypothetical protein
MRARANMTHYASAVAVLVLHTIAMAGCYHMDDAANAEPSERGVIYAPAPYDDVEGAQAKAQIEAAEKCAPRQALPVYSDRDYAACDKAGGCSYRFRYECANP